MEPEIRTLKTELRTAPGWKLVGIAARYGTRSANLGGFVETIAPGAFAKTLASGDKVVALKNHDANFILGSTKSGTLTLSDSPEGLRFSIQLSKENTAHMDTYQSVKRGDLDACSFAFRVNQPGGDSWSETKDAQGKPLQLRTLKDVSLADVSVVAFPAYPQGTEVDARSFLESRGLLRVAARTAPIAPQKKFVARQLSPEECARLNGQTLDEFHRAKQAILDSVRRRTCRDLGKVIARQTDADLRRRAAAASKVISKDDEQEAKDEAMRAHMANLAGHTCRAHRRGK